MALTDYLGKAGSIAKATLGKVALPVSVGVGLFGNAGKAGMSDEEEQALIRRDNGIVNLKNDNNYQAPNLSGVPADAASAIPDIGSGQSGQQTSAARTSQSLANMIGRGWDNLSTGDVSKAVKSYGGSIGMLSKARDAYLAASEQRKAAKEAAILGNKQLIDKYQTGDLRNLGAQLRSKTLNTNLALGAASGGSAGLAAARALAKQNAMERANTLTQYGDEISAQNRQQSLIEPEYQAERQKAYDWEARNKQSLVENYNIQKKALDRLKGKVPEWKQKDLENENDDNLRNLLSGLASIESQARSSRDNLYNTYYGMMDEATAMGDANLNIQAPSQLDTPEFDPSLDMTGLEDTEYETGDYYRPSAKLKRKEGRSIFDNPLVFEEA